MGKELRYADVDRLSRALAAWLQSRGLAQGDRVAVMNSSLPLIILINSGLLIEAVLCAATVPC